MARHRLRHPRFRPDTTGDHPFSFRISRRPTLHRLMPKTRHPATGQSGTMSEKPSFSSELKRRNVYKVAVAYIVGGWAISQGIAQVFPVFDVPNGAIRLVVLLIIIGLPVALVLAWAFEITPQGIKRTGTADAMPQQPGQKKNAWIYVVVVGVVVSIGLFFLGRYTAGHAAPRKSEAATAVPGKSIAVLPLINESGDPQDEYFSDGLSEELIAALAQISGLKVIGRSSSFRFKDRKEDPKLIGKKLGVSTLLDGTVRKQGDRVRIVAALVNVADGIQLWTQTFEIKLKDIVVVQEEIARAVAQSLKVTVLGSGEKSIQMATNSVEAHNAYLQGHFYLQRRNLEDYRKAITYFDRAIELDPTYALAYAERAEAWTVTGDLSGQRSIAYPKARSDAEKAVAIAPSLAEAHAALGWVRAFTEWKFAEGLSELQRAKQLSPANPTANDLLARIIVYTGRIEDAERQAREAVELDPLSAATYFNLARVLYYAGKRDEAEAAGRKMAELQPSAASSHRWQVLASIERGDGETALREAQLEPDEGFRAFELALAHYIRGDRKAADAALADLVAHGREGFAYQIAEVYALRGEKDTAFEWLQIAFDNHDGGMLSLLVDPVLRGLRDDARYKNLVAKVGLPTT